MAAESDPRYPAWNEALEHVVEAERRYYTAIMEGRPTDRFNSWRAISIRPE